MKKNKALIFCSIVEKGILHMLFKDTGAYEISGLIAISPLKREIT